MEANSKIHPIVSVSLYSELQNELETITQLKIENGDKLAVVAGRLQISKGGFLQAPSRTIQDFRFGGFNRKDVLKRLEEISNIAEKIIKKIEKENNDQEIKYLKKKIKKASFILYEVDLKYQNQTTKTEAHKKFFSIYEKFSNHYTCLKILFPFYPRRYPIATLFHMPKGKTPEDMLELASRHKKREVPLWKKVYAITLSLFILTIFSIPLICLNLFKWVIWNPSEFIARKEITTNSPFGWFLEEGKRFVKQNYFPEVKKTITLYANQILGDNIITDKHLNIFKKIAKDVTKIDLSSKRLVSSNLDELYFLSQDQDWFKALPKEKEAKQAFQKIIDALDQVHHLNIEMLYTIWKDEIHWVMDPNYQSDPKDLYKYEKFQDWKKKFNEKTSRLDYFIPNNELIQTFKDLSRSCILQTLSFQHFKEIIEITGKNKTIKTISFSSLDDFGQNSTIMKLLEQNHFKKRIRNESDQKILFLRSN